MFAEGQGDVDDPRACGMCEHFAQLPPAAAPSARAEPPAMQPPPAVSAAAALITRAQLLREALAEESDMTGALANIRRRIRQLQAAVHVHGAQAAAEADGVRQLGPSRWNTGNAGERPRATGWGRIL